MGDPRQEPGFGEEDPVDRRSPQGPPGEERAGQEPDDAPGEPSEGGLPGGDASPWQGHGAPLQHGSDDQAMALVPHLGGLLLSVLGPLVVYLAAKKGPPYVRHHAVEALNFQITVLLGLILASVSMILTIGALVLPVVVVADIVFAAMAAMAANRGEWYRYPVSLRLVR